MPKKKPKPNAGVTISCPGLTGPCPAWAGLSIEVKDQHTKPSGKATPETGTRSRGADKKRDR